MHWSGVLTGQVALDMCAAVEDPGAERHTYQVDLLKLIVLLVVLTLVLVPIGFRFGLMARNFVLSCCTAEKCLVSWTAYARV